MATPGQQTQPTGSAIRALGLEYRSLQEEPVEGFRVKLINDDNLFEWEVAIFGPPDTLYQGGYFKVSTGMGSLPFVFVVIHTTCTVLRCLSRLGKIRNEVQTYEISFLDGSQGLFEEQ